MTVARIWPCSRACTPAMVVPPGLVTWSLSSPGCLPVSRTMVAAPRTVFAASCVATGRGSPALTPPSLSASMNWNTYAGPEPDRPVTASRSASLTLNAVPRAPSMEPTTAASAGVHDSLGAYAAASSPTRHGVLGMTRTTRFVGASQLVRLFRVMPAAMDTTRALGLPTAISAHTSATCAGFTAMTTRSERLATSLLSCVVLMLSSLLSESRHGW
mmetsp:Transcript_30273/g.81370  ORF Transcript_30273/g.81370 Transcript_30273/m.81370 type:complete len:215 (+) Transcript_30273:420-1064(+)